MTTCIILTLIVMLALLFVGFFTLALCRVAGEADDRAERMYQNWRLHHGS